MIPRQLTAGSFANYPPAGRSVATEHLALLQRMPLAFLPIFLRELIGYDWMLPGSGTQIFSTTFVQWAARECLRRAQPETIVLHYAPDNRCRR
jgi:hypothetical protein